MDEEWFDKSGRLDYGAVEHASMRKKRWASEAVQWAMELINLNPGDITPGGYMMGTGKTHGG
jgi:hypothetical protein